MLLSVPRPGQPTHARAWLLHDTDALPGAAHARLHELATRRLAGEPMAYLTGSKAFYGCSCRSMPACSTRATTRRRWSIKASLLRAMQCCVAPVNENHGEASARAEGMAMPRGDVRHQMSLLINRAGRLEAVKRCCWRFQRPEAGEYAMATRRRAVTEVSIFALPVPEIDIRQRAFNLEAFRYLLQSQNRVHAHTCLIFKNF